MILTIRSEWLKLRTVRVHFVLSIIALAFPLIVAVLASSFGTDPENVRTYELAENIVGTAIISVMLLGAIAAISLTSEFAHGTIRPTFAATPNRVHVMAAKVFVNSVVAGILTSGLVAVCWVLAAAIHNSRGADVSLSMDDGSVGVLTGLVILAVIITWFAFGIGLIVRNSSATVTFLLLWPLVIENILSGVFSLLNVDGLTKWLPYRAGFEAAIFVTPSEDALGRPGGLLWFGAVSAALVAFGLVVNVKRDA